MAYRGHDHGLAPIRWLFVIARNSSFVYKGRAVDVKQVARELGVRYSSKAACVAPAVACASPRSSSMRRVARITGPSVTIREIADIFAIQDEITRSVAGAIEPHCLPPRACGRCPAPRAILEHGSWWRARKGAPYRLAHDPLGLVSSRSNRWSAP